MGIYDTKIYELRKKIDEMYSEINLLKNEIDELEELSDKCDSINQRVSESIGNIFTNIEKNGANIPGNFLTYYKNQIDQIAKKNNLYNFSGEISSEKAKVKDKILANEEEIQRLYSSINLMENDLSYYSLKNVKNSQMEL